MKTLIIPDIHQNFDFLHCIEKRENLDNFDQVVLLGDIFDSRDYTYDNLNSLKKTLDILREWKTRMGSRLLWLWGNHDLGHYWKSLWDYSCQVYGVPMSSLDLGIFWKSFQFVAVVDSYILSHAGIHKSFWEMMPEKSEGQLNNFCQMEMDSSMDKGELSPLFLPGISRGGDQPVGGILWQDWYRDFEDNLRFVQIVGHTAGCNVRKASGGSVCLDATQTAYGVLIDGNLNLVEYL
jgi:hypothetical protein